MQKLKNLLGIMAIGLITVVTLSAQNSGTFQGQAIQPDGKILIWGSNIVVSGVPSGMVARLNSNGSRDGSFNFCGCSFIYVNRLLVQPDGKILISGNMDPGGGSPFSKSRIARMNADGSADATFTPYEGTSAPTSSVGLISLQPDGKILAVNSTGFGFPFGSSIGILRLNTNGSRDNPFSIFIGSGNSTLTGFGGLAVNSDGKLYVAITPAPTGPVPQPVQRHNADGGVDGTWPAPTVSGGIRPGVYALEILSNDDLVFGGNFSSVNGTGVPSIVRMTPAGAVDPTFVYNGTITENFTFTRIHALPTGKLLVRDNGGTLRRLNSNGSIDTTFVPASTVSSGFSVDSLGRIVSTGGPGYFRLNPDGDLDGTFIFGFRRPDFDFDGDGKSDVGVFRPSEGNWYLSQSQSGFSSQNFGLNGDVITPGDFDGDGKTDLAIWRPSTGTWWYKSTVNGGYYAVWWGQAGDIPLAEDFNGDGRADYVYYRPSNSTWHRLGSTGGYSAIAFGTAGDIPLVADMDGDGKADPTIYRPSTGTWWYASSINGLFYALQWGTATDIPVPGDYDGDGKTDPAYFRPSNGDWFIVYSGTNYTTYTVTNWGVAGDRPTPGDYDGDGKTDLAIYRPSNGMWFELRSTSGFFSQQFGLPGDEAVPNAFVP